MGDFDEVVQSQYGLVTRPQGVDFFGRWEFERRVKRGDFPRLVNGLYRVAGSPTSPEQELFGSTLIYGGYASHRACAALRGFSRYVELRNEITVPAGVGSRSKRLGLETTIHRSSFLPSTHLEIVRGIPATTAARAICDLSVFLSPISLGKVLDDAKRRGLVTYEAVAACRNDLRVRGRRRTTVIDEILEYRGIGFDPGESEPELDLRTWLEDAGIFPVAQHPVIINGKKRRLDLALPEPMIAIEYQGVDAHGNAVALIDDSERTTELQLAGWLVVLITKATGRRRAVELVREALAIRAC